MASGSNVKREINPACFHEVLIRFFDQREVDNAKIACEVKKYLDTIALLFFEEKVWAAEGHTKVVLDFLASSTHFVVRGAVRSIGGPLAVSADLRKRVLTRMQAWTVLAREVVVAEHPAYELVSCFTCFDLERWPQQCPHELIRHGRTKQFDDDLGRLATAFSVDPRGLTNEFFDLGDRAHVYFDKAKCSNLQAWQWAMSSTSLPLARKRHPIDNLQHVLAEYSCMSASDSCIERDFSRVKSLLGEQRLNIAEDTESNLLILLLSEPSDDADAIKHAQKVWKELYAGSRGPLWCDRSDKGAQL